MEKYYKPIFLILILIIIVISVFYKMDQLKNEKIKIAITKNSLKIDNFEMSKNVNDSGGFYLIKSKVAYFSKSMDKVDLEQCDIEYSSDNSTLVFSAETCIYVIDKQLTLEKNIIGTYNSINFKSGENGLFVFELTTETGFIKNGIHATRGQDSIYADSLTIDRNNNKLEFRDNVEVKYATQ